MKLSIGRRLALSFVLILSIFAFNLGVYIVGNRFRNDAIERLVMATEHHDRLVAVDRELDSINREIQTEQAFLLDPLTTEPMLPKLLEQKRERLDALQGQLSELIDQVGRAREMEADAEHASDLGGLREEIRVLLDTFEDFADGLVYVYRNVGVDYVKVITETTNVVEPARNTMNGMVPPLLDEVSRRRAMAKQHFDEVDEQTNLAALSIFAVSAFVGLGIAFLMSRYLVRGLRQLEAGATALAEGDMAHRIDTRARDELGDLARTFNDMASRLDQAQRELTAKNDELEETNLKIDEAHKVSQSLLENILPESIAAELTDHGEVVPKYFEDVTVLFTDFKGFTLSTENMAAEELVERLHDYFTAFDQVIGRYGLEKLKTIGDSYMCAGGMPDRSPSHAVDCVLAGFEMIRIVQERLTTHPENPWNIRIGIHTGSVIAGVVGIKKFAFDIWGDTVNFASRMESSGEAGRVNLSEATASRIKDFIETQPRGKIRTKDGRDVPMFFATGVNPNLLADDGSFPPPAFAKRYATYFQKELPLLSPLLVSGSETTMSMDPKLIPFPNPGHKR